MCWLICHIDASVRIADRRALISKCAAGRQKDSSFLEAVARHGQARHHELVLRLTETKLARAPIRAERLLAKLFGG
jgi:hypothetical protein